MNDGRDSEDFSCDLVGEAKRHLLFLKTAHALGVTLERPSYESIRRYSKLWIPLLGLDSKTFDEKKIPKDVSLIPPPDIAWLWHCHRLAPFQYMHFMDHELDISEKTNLLDMNAPFAMQIDPKSDLGFSPPVQCDSTGEYIWINHSSMKDVKETRKLWSAIYPDESFFLHSSSFSEKDGESEGFVQNYNLLDASERQSTFLWQVQGDQYDNDEFLKDGVKNYRKFILLKATEAGMKQMIVPTCQIDLMWHTHILFSTAKYNDYCRNMIGCELNHDDTIHERQEGGLLDVSFQATKRLWEKTYRESYTVLGGMYPGDPPASFFQPKSFNNTSNTHNEATTHSVTLLQWANPYEYVNGNIKGFTQTDPSHESYIFGYSRGFGAGYYYIRTKEAYQIIEMELIGEISRIICCWLCVFVCFGKDHVQGLLDTLQSALSSVRKQLYELDAPAEALELPNDFLTRMQQPRFSTNYGGGGGCGGGCGGGGG